MKTILLTGATGFIGSHLLELLVTSGYNVVVLKRKNSDTTRINKFMGLITSFDIDEVEYDDVFRSQKVDVIIHVACLYGRSGELISNVFETNVLFPLRLAEKACKYGVSVFINTDTFFVKSDTLLGYMAPYVLSKKLAWDFLNFFSSSLKVINIRLEHVYGPKDDKSKFVPWLCSHYISEAMNEKKVELSSCLNVRDFVYISDVVKAYEKVLIAIDEIKSGSVFEVGTGSGSLVKDFVLILDKIFSGFGKSMVELSFDSSRDREGEIACSIADLNMMDSIGWCPEINLVKGITFLVNSEMK